MFAALVFCITAFLADSGLNQALRFPESGDTSNYVKLNPDFSRVKTSVSICSWIKQSLDSRKKHYWFSYAVPRKFNQLVIGDWERHFVVDVPIMLKGVVTLKNEWYHYCLTWSSSTGMDFYINGVLVKSQRITGSSIGSGGILVLGQEQDSFGGGFDQNQAFGGEIHLLNVFSRKLRVEEVAAIYFDGRCSRLPSSLVHDVVVSWEEFLGAQRFGAVQDVPTECDIGGNFAKVTKLVLQEHIEDCQKLSTFLV